MTNFILVRGFYDTLNLFSQELEAGLAAAGAGTFVLHAERLDEELSDLLTLHVTKGITAVIAFNNLCYNLGTKEGGNLWEAMGVPYFDILMDHPFHFDTILQGLPAKTTLFVVDRKHVDYVKRYYPNVSSCVFLPHAGCRQAVKAAPAAEERDIDVLYAGVLSRVLIEQLIPDFDSITAFDGAAFSGRCLDRLISEPALTTEEVVRRELREEGLTDLPPEEERKYITDFRFLDGFACSFYREGAVRTLVESGIDVHVLGLGWEQCEWAGNPRLHLDGKVDAVEVFPYMKRSKVVLNTLTWFKDGAHDRIFNGMLAGAAVVSDTSPYLREIFDDTQCVQYNLNHTSHLPALVEDLLADDERREALAEAGREETERNHTWAARAQIILDEAAKAQADAGRAV